MTLKMFRYGVFVAMIIGAIGYSRTRAYAENKCANCTSMNGHCEPAGQGEGGWTICNDSPTCSVAGATCTGGV